MKALAALLLVALPAAAQTPAPETKTEQRPLNLKLDEPAYAKPKITFEPRDAKPEQRPGDSLPGLGGAPNRAYERPLSVEAPNSPFPKDTNPNMR